MRRGRFTLKGVEDNFTITVTSIGYEKRVIKVTKETTQLVIQLQVAVNDLDRKQ